MTSFHAIARLTAVALFATALGVSLGCSSGNSSDSTTSSGPVAKFTPDTASPGAGTIALLPGSSSGPSVSVRVTVTDVSSFFGATFRVKYDVAALVFNGMTTTDSFLLGGVTSGDVNFFEDHQTTPGEILITATRLNPDVAPPVTVTATSDLVVLNFAARLAIAAGATEGRLDFGDPKEVCDGTVNPTNNGCNPIPGLTWSGGGVSAQ